MGRSYENVSSGKSLKVYIQNCVGVLLLFYVFCFFSKRSINSRFYPLRKTNAILSAWWKNSSSIKRNGTSMTSSCLTSSPRSKASPSRSSLRNKSITITISGGSSLRVPPTPRPRLPFWTQPARRFSNCPMTPQCVSNLACMTSPITLATSSTAPPRDRCGGGDAAVVVVNQLRAPVKDIRHSLFVISWRHVLRK